MGAVTVTAARNVSPRVVPIFAADRRRSKLDRGGNLRPSAAGGGRGGS